MEYCAGIVTPVVPEHAPDVPVIGFVCLVIMAYCSVYWCHVILLWAQQPLLNSIISLFSVGNNPNVAIRETVNTIMHGGNNNYFLLKVGFVRFLNVSICITYVALFFSIHQSGEWGLLPISVLGYLLIVGIRPTLELLYYLLFLRDQEYRVLKLRVLLTDTESLEPDDALKNLPLIVAVKVDTLALNLPTPIVKEILEYITAQPSP